MENFWELFFSVWWAWIPIVAILAGSFKEWLKFKEKQRQLGASTHDLEEAMAATQADFRNQQAALTERIQNLEAIVTSQAWDALHDPALPTPETERRLNEARIAFEHPDPEPSDADRAAQLARRLKA